MLSLLDEAPAAAVLPVLLIVAWLVLLATRGRVGARFFVGGIGVIMLVALLGYAVGASGSCDNPPSRGDTFACMRGLRADFLVTSTLAAFLALAVLALLAVLTLLVHLLWVPRDAQPADRTD